MILTAKLFLALILVFLGFFIFPWITANLYQLSMYCDAQTFACVSSFTGTFFFAILSCLSIFGSVYMLVFTLG